MHVSISRTVLLLSLSSFLHAQECDPANPFGAGCDSSGPAIAIDAGLHICHEIIFSCPGGFPTSAFCVQEYCKYGCTDQNNCCPSSDPHSCFQSSSSTPTSGSGTGSNDGGGSSSGVSGGGQSIPAGASMCTYVADIVSACESSTPGFSTLPNSQQASCFCFNNGGSGKYNGTVWDNAASTCYSALVSESASQSVLDAYSSNVLGACTRLVQPDVLTSAGVGTGVSANPTAATQTTAPQTGTRATAGSATPTKNAAATMVNSLAILLAGFTVASFAIQGL